MLFGVLNVLQGALVGAIPFVATSREALVNVVIWAAGALMILSGPLLVLAGRWGRRIAAAVCLLYWVLGLIGVGLIVASASYLFGIYGHHGAAAGALATVLALLVAVVFWLLPAHELHFLRGVTGDPK
jgi:hypothetical protein